jgi:hypothetical protein
MTEFNNRIDAQREILNLVNRRQWKEELFGLSSGAIDRWIRANDLDASAPLPTAIRSSAEKLFFLANKSQEQVTEEYRSLSGEVSEITSQIARITDFG